MALVQEKNTTELAPGGSDASRFDVAEAWYPVFYVEDLNKKQLTRFTLLSRDLVIWWEQNTNSWRVFEDKCPHRLVPLSEGRINEQGWLECPYHGWAFSGTGQCEIIPQEPEGGKAYTSRRACATALPATVKQGLLFVYPGKPENADKTPVPIVDPLEENASEWICLNTFRDLPYDAFTLLENVLDSSHIPYTHHATVGNRANVAPLNLEIVHFDRQGFHGAWPEGPRKGTLGRQDTMFIAPSLMWHDLTSKQFGRTLTVVYATPIRKGECRLFARFPFKFSSPIPKFFINITPRWYSHLGQNSILEDDQIFLHYQERYLEQAGGSNNFNQAFYLPTAGDLFVAQFRKWIKEYQAEPFPNVPLSPPLSRVKLLDRYHSHTVHCSSCRGALKNLKSLRIALVILAFLCLVISPLLAVLWGSSGTSIIGGFAIASLIFLGTWLGLGRLEQQFYQGYSIPARNLK